MSALKEPVQQSFQPGGTAEPSGGGAAATLLSNTHTPQEQRLYELMLEETSRAHDGVGFFTIRYLMGAAGVNSFTTVRRARTGLVKKMSIECVGGDNGARAGALYRVYTPEEIIGRGPAVPLRPSNGGAVPAPASSPRRGAGWLREELNLSRRESQVAVFCAQGLTNAGIGQQLGISDETVKFHLRNVFIKLGVSRRAELVSYLLS